jgi:UDP-glucose 4-epimerase
LARSAPPAGLFPAEVAVVRGTLGDPLAILAALDGVEIVFHLAAMLHINDPRHELRDEYRRVNVEGTRSLVQAIAATGARLIFFSTINVYGPSQPGQVFDERSPLRPDSWYGETKAQAEEIALAGVSAAVLRLAAVYGPRMKGNYFRLLRALERNRFVPIGSGQNRRTLVQIDDVCSAALLTAAHPGALGHVYNVTDGQIHTLREIIAAICQALGRQPPGLYLPAAPIQLAAGLLDDGFRLLGRQAPIGRSTVQKLLEDVAVSGDKLQRQLGFRPRYDLVGGWREMVHHRPVIT